PGGAGALGAGRRASRSGGVLPASSPAGRRKTRRAPGARVVLPPPADRARGAARLAARLAEERGWFLASQFDNPANPAFHRQTTGPEILSDFAMMRLDYWGTGWGTGGPPPGVGLMVKQGAPRTQVLTAQSTGPRRRCGAQRGQ